MNLQIIRANEADIAVIQQLANKIWWAHYPNIIGDDQVTYMLNRFYSENALMEQMQLGQQFYLIQSESDFLGFVAITAVSPSEYFINKFYVDIEQHRQGIGSKVFEALLAMYSDAQVIKLQVNRMNYKPINFYFKMGFIIERVADFDIGDGYFMNDFVMKWESKGSKG